MNIKTTNIDYQLLKYPKNLVVWPKQVIIYVYQRLTLNVGSRVGSP